MVIPNMIAPELFALKMTCYGVFIVLMIFLFYKLFKEIINKDRSSLPVYDYNKDGTLAILISPARVIFLSMVMILLSGAVVILTIFVGTIHKFELMRPGNYLPFILCLIFGFIFFKGVQLWIRRNEVVQLRFTPYAVQYMPVDINGVGRGRGISILTMYFRTKMTSLNYDNIGRLI